MAGVNRVFLIGHLGADPEVRFAGDKAVANFRIATSESWKDKQGQKQERTEWHSIVAWAKLGELCGQHLSRGRQVCVEGKLQTRKWQDKNGADRYTTEIVAQNVTFLGGGNGNDSGKREQQSSQSRASDDSGFDYGPPPMSSDDVPF